MKVSRNVAFLIVCACPVFGHIAQTRPRFCGLPENTSVPVPLGVSMQVTNNEAELITDGEKAILLPDSYYAKILQICSLSGGKLAVLSDVGRGHTVVYIVDTLKQEVVDWFYGFSPVISPDRRWIVYDKFLPGSVQAPTTSEYLIYDLTRTPAQNRSDGNVDDHYDNIGAVIYPPGQKNLPLDNIGVPEEQVHAGGYDFYWAPDSRAIVFGDLTRAASNVVLVKLDDRGIPTAFEHDISRVDPCGFFQGNWAEFVRHAEIGPGSSEERVLLVEIQSSIGCKPRSIGLHESDFRPAKAEVHVLPKPAKKARKAEEPAR